MSSANDPRISNQLLDLIFEAIDYNIESKKLDKYLTDVGEVVPHPSVWTLSNGKHLMTRLIVDDIDGAESMLHQIINREQEPVEAYAFVLDAYVHISEEKEDAILVEGAERGSETGFLFAQRYRKASKGIEFEVIGNPALIDYPRSRFENIGKRKIAVLQQESIIRVQLPCTKEEGDLLVAAPLLVFIAVAGSDGNIDDKESAAFVKRLREAADSKNAFIAAIFSQTIDRATELSSDIMAGKYKIAEDLLRAVEILNKYFPQDAAKTFKEILLSIGIDVAGASGGGLFGLGSKISKQEKEALSAIREILNCNSQNLN